MATESILFDTMVVSWGIRADANPEQRQLVHWTHKFIEQCQRDRVRIFIPAPVVAESLLPVPIEQHELVIETYARHFRVLPFDLAAAREFARIWAKREPKIREDDLRGGSAPKKRFYRFDCQIVAIAISRKLDCIYSHDKDVERFAGGEIEVRQVPEPPPDQITLW